MTAKEIMEIQIMLKEKSDIIAELLKACKEAESSITEAIILEKPIEAIKRWRQTLTKLEQAIKKAEEA